MTDYDFKTLSSYDFALMARDLLQAHLDIKLESFSAGPDSGIDFRCNEIGLVVQCKHYAESGFASLISILRRKERQKIDKLKPARYILATSASLTPNRKEELLNVLKPHSASPSDIYGREDLNNLLRQHPEIERRNLKLWLTSETVLRRVLEAGIFSDSEAHLDRVRLRLSRYVQNPSFERARTFLERFHNCIIAGIPGIGKTTLAEVLLADLVDRHGFEAFRIAHDLAEIRPVKNSQRKQVFYFDDFLGKTVLGNLQKNEDQRLMELMEEVASCQNWRFILTTREYILNSARQRYEAFAQPIIDFNPCVIKLEDYTRPIRAKILYNHIYFSDLTKAHKLALLQDKGYESILGHRNYNPRVIEYMTQASHASKVSPSLYLSEFNNNLEHPERIWDHAFRYQISEASRHLLVVLCTLPDDVLLNDLECAFWTFYRFRQGRFGFSTSSLDWTDALKQLDGSFIATKRMGEDLVVSFHNPSIKDFVEDFMATSEGDVLDIINSSYFYEQYTKLWSGKRGTRYSGVDNHHEDFLRQLRKGIWNPSAAAVRAVNRNGETIGFHHELVSFESRAEFAIRVANDIQNATSEKFLKVILQTLEQLWIQGKADRQDLVRLLQALTTRGLKPEDKTFIAAKRCLSRKPEEIGDFRALANFIKTYPNALTDIEREAIDEEFLKFASEYAEGWDDDDPDWLRQVAADLEFVGERLGLDVVSLTDPLYQKADEVEMERAQEEREDDYDRGEWEPPYTQGDEIEEMFNSLKEGLTET
jgi:hypothetical protein